MSPQSASIDPADVERFERLSERWWDPRGPMRPLHQINPLRLRFVEEQLAGQGADLAGLRVLDIGCGGGLFSEALARASASTEAGKCALSAHWMPKLEGQTPSSIE
jgi:2-polyprenyl-6-hydroxyphenyl methylase/3-demethylubiquinone-9 3-methyltransferase